MVIYEVNIDIALDRDREFYKWLKVHIEEMLEISGFINANIFRAEDSNIYTVFYKVESREKLDEYFQLHADKMRQEGIDKFGDSLRASRRILEKLG